MRTSGHREKEREREREREQVTSPLLRDALARHSSTSAHLVASVSSVSELTELASLSLFLSLFLSLSLSLSPSLPLSLSLSLALSLPLSLPLSPSSLSLFLSLYLSLPDQERDKRNTRDKREARGRWLRQTLKHTWSRPNRDRPRWRGRCPRRNPALSVEGSGFGV